ncbi:MAG: hypothetical protein Q8S54_19295 [Bacteroidota bacterium]|nr:hypothetical protein [Odoribacter sp.]MDP3645317.1 hypothetical protein [Bacteroidota bacterium]
MNILNLKKHRYFPGIWLLVVIILLFVMLFSPVRNIGIVVISLVALYVAISSYSKFSNTNDNRFRSRARDQDFKDQKKISE